MGAGGMMADDGGWMGRKVRRTMWVGKGLNMP